MLYTLGQVGDAATQQGLYIMTVWMEMGLHMPQMHLVLQVYLTHQEQNRLPLPDNACEAVA